jgi:hypothetical protein
MGVKKLGAGMGSVGILPAVDGILPDTRRETRAKSGRWAVVG